ncbi:MAG: hypothetical protein HYZ17_14805 [Betaproteobacteria bacterium]|nr:hypothetical protein [Betaproteobacteria bacterium]
MLIQALPGAHDWEGFDCGLFVDAIDETAARFYQRYGFTNAPDHPLLLFLALGAARA